MLRCNLAVLLAERNLKITKVSQDTGISRTTLTALANNRVQGIQFSTLDTLCLYLNVTPEKLISFVSTSIINIEAMIGTFATDTSVNFSLLMQIYETKEYYPCLMSGTIYLHLESGTVTDIYIGFNELVEDGNDLEYFTDKRICRAFRKLSRPFLRQIRDEISQEIIQKLKGHENVYKWSDSIQIYFSWQFDNGLTE